VPCPAPLPLLASLLAYLTSLSADTLPSSPPQLQSLLEVLYVPVGASGDLLVLRPPLGSQHSPAADQHADALNQGYVEALVRVNKGKDGRGGRRERRRAT
jgi:hypothetical protein